MEGVGELTLAATVAMECCPLFEGRPCAALGAFPADMIAHLGPRAVGHDQLLGRLADPAAEVCACWRRRGRHCSALGPLATLILVIGGEIAHNPGRSPH